MGHIANVELSHRAGILALRQQQEGVLAQVRKELFAEGQQCNAVKLLIEVSQYRYRVGCMSDLERDYHRETAARPQHPNAVDEERQPGTTELAQFETHFGGASQGSATRIAGERLVSNKRWIPHDNINRPQPLRAGRKEVGCQQIPLCDAILAELVTYAAVNSRVQFNAKHLRGRIAAQRSKALAGGSKEDAASKGGVQDSVGGISNRPPHKKFRDLGVGVVRAKSFRTFQYSDGGDVIHDSTLYRRIVSEIRLGFEEAQL